MEGIAGVIVFVALIAISIASAIDKQKKAAHRSVSPGVPTQSVSTQSVSTQSVSTQSVSTQAAQAHESSSEWYSLETQPVSTYNAETAPRRMAASAAEVAASDAEENSIAEMTDNEQVMFDIATDFDLRRAVIEAEILTPKYF